MNYLNTPYPMIHFRKVQKQKIYVDKSMLISRLNGLIGTNDCYVCITRPRRFGKTTNANMLGAYYTKEADGHSLFDHLSISDDPTYQEHLNRHNVIYIDFSRMPDTCSSYEDYINYVKDGIREDLEETYGLSGRPGVSVSDLLRDSGEFFIFILDEWDAVFYEKFMSREDKTHYLKFIKNLLKDQPYVELAYMTGILPIAKYSSGSELNMFREYNFMNDYIYEAYFGMSEEEVRKLCGENQSVSYEELKYWYDGYYMSDGRSLFNPRSVNCALSDGVCLNYWTETGPMNEVADCIEHNVDEVREDIVKMVAGIPVEVELQGYSVSELELNTRDEILSAMVVYGFLSYHDGMLRIPNYELMEKYQKVLARDSMGEVKKIVNGSREMLEATLACDEIRVASMLEEVHDREIPFLEYHDENALSCVITLCYLYARKDYEIEREAKSGKGYCDYLFRPKKAGIPAIILELKVGKSCEDAIAQIKEKNYIQKVKECREILLVGINYDKNKHHECRIEKIVTK
ncbi:AAA family ATPase [Faecalicatena sp. AGMB00832]|uniref:AAA family ATPase n=1 Tax=Faecalicatena faecalis TaxID=2726362 RepID=A0ABS6D993_9FIRM|nr:AAA family ATPase [Faecalicatena faecalis]MBU3878071.1 AAA family ATPase [Faecalicatena faecalis]